MSMPSENVQTENVENGDVDNGEEEVFFINTGKRNTPSLFVDGFKFSHNKNITTTTGDIVGYFYCSKKNKPPNGCCCKASAKALKSVEGDEFGEMTTSWSLISVSSNHLGHLPSPVIQKVCQCRESIRDRVLKNPIEKAKKVYTEEVNR